MPKVLPRYPVYIPSKGRYEKPYTARCLDRDGVPFYLVVEPQEYDAYASVFGPARVLQLPFSNLGQGSIPARNWIKQHAIESGAVRHWQLDDNMRDFYRVYKGKRMYCAAGIALRACEDFTDRYENIAISGLNYKMFYPEYDHITPFFLNVHVYSCTLVLNSIPHQWRGRYNEDTDICLQVLADGWCTVLINAFLVNKLPTMTVGGGNTAQLYQGDGRLKMARALERVWPGVVYVDRRWQRPQHVVKDSWKAFDTPLKLRADLDRAELAATRNDYGLVLRQVAPEVKSAAMRQLQAQALLEREMAQTETGV